MEPIIIALLVLNLIAVLVIIFITFKSRKNDNFEKKIDEKIISFSENIKDIMNFQSERIKDIDRNISEKYDIFTKNILSQQTQINSANQQQLLTSDKNVTEKLSAMQTAINDKLYIFGKRLQGFTSETVSSLENIRVTMDKQLKSLQEDNNKKLDEMRQIVDEKLQKTLNERMNESFKLVNERLEQVYKGLGEMQTLAQGVGDLKKVLSNVKSRGIVGEIQLGAILQEILSPEQYDVNVSTKPNSKNVVEFAIKLPTDDGDFIYLPIDSKFPGDTYAHLQNAYENGTKEDIDNCAKNLINTMKAEAKSINEKYIAPPYTTEFAIMFLPFEGLYAEAVNRGLVEILQREYHINIAGPSTMAALLNSLQMGFKAFAIQKRSGEVWKVLSAVKTEFDKFETVLKQAQNRLNQAHDELEKLVGTRTRSIQRSLKNVISINDTESTEILKISEEE